MSQPADASQCPATATSLSEAVAQDGPNGTSAGCAADDVIELKIQLEKSQKQVDDLTARLEYAVRVSQGCSLYVASERERGQGFGYTGRGVYAISMFKHSSRKCIILYQQTAFGVLSNLP